MPFTEKIKSSMKDLIPFHLKWNPDPGWNQIQVHGKYSPDCRSSEEGTVGTLLSCTVMGLLFWLANDDISTFQKTASQIDLLRHAAFLDLSSFAQRIGQYFFQKTVWGGAFLSDFQLIALC